MFFLNIYFYVNFSFFLILDDNQKIMRNKDDYTIFIDLFSITDINKCSKYWRKTIWIFRERKLAKFILFWILRYFNYSIFRCSDWYKYWRITNWTWIHLFAKYWHKFIWNQLFQVKIFSIKKIINSKKYFFLLFSGEITTKSRIDREKLGNSVNFLIIGVSGKKTQFLNIKINIIDENDNAPIFPQNEYTVTVGGYFKRRRQKNANFHFNKWKNLAAESTKVGSHIIIATASDQDIGANGEISKYEIEKSENSDSNNPFEMVRIFWENLKFQI